MRWVDHDDKNAGDRLDKLQKSTQRASGLLLATHAKAPSNITHLLRLLPTPTASDDHDDHDRHTKAVVPDAPWMRAHADMAAKMLPGGVHLVGAYVFTSSRDFTQAEAALRPMLASMLKALADQGIEEPEALLLLLPNDAKKPSARVLTHPSAPFKPTELKRPTVPLQLRRVSTTWHLDAHLELPVGASPAARLALLREQLAAVSAPLEDATMTIDGELRATTQPLGAIPQRTAGRAHLVRIFWKPGTASTAPAAQHAARLSGALHGCAICPSTASIGCALRALRRDLALTLDVRLSHLLDELEEEDGADKDGPFVGAWGPGAWALPRRAHVDVGGGLSLCDHVPATDEPSDCAERFSEVLGVKLPSAEPSDFEALFVDEMAVTVEASSGAGGGDDDAGVEATAGSPASSCAPPSVPGAKPSQLSSTALSAVAVGLAAMMAAMFLVSGGGEVVE